MTDSACVKDVFSASTKSLILMLILVLKIGKCRGGISGIALQLVTQGCSREFTQR